MGGMDEDWTKVLAALAASGADAVEVGIPFSDPMMDGPTIQDASLQALGRGTTPSEVLSGIRSADISVPVALMTYYNVVFRFGHLRMARSMADSGVSAAIIPDLCLEEIDPWAEQAHLAGIETILLVAPSTPDSRMQAICERAQGFIYVVARMGVTGERSDSPEQAKSLVESVRRFSDLPVCVGIGVSTPQQAAEVCSVADGVIVGSALVRRLLDNAGVDAASEFIGQIRAAID